MTNTERNTQNTNDIEENIMAEEHVNAIPQLLTAVIILTEKFEELHLRIRALENIQAGQWPEVGNTPEEEEELESYRNGTGYDDEDDFLTELNYNPTTELNLSDLMRGNM